VADDVRPQVEAELAAEHERIAGGVEKAVEIGVVDEIVSPSATRSALARAIREADRGQRGQHTNIPL
jgi:acetyl-CoA/propionyl-CoA carboxylase carboxyl transferase subunit